MPTARELIEQADALMRRNRTNAVDDIPVLTEADMPSNPSAFSVRQDYRSLPAPHPCRC